MAKSDTQYAKDQLRRRIARYRRWIDRRVGPLVVGGTAIAAAVGGQRSWRHRLWDAVCNVMTSATAPESGGDDNVDKKNPGADEK